MRVIAEMYLKPPDYDYPLQPDGAGYTLAYGLSLIGSLALGVTPAPALRLTGMLTRILH
jgi:hypothetical protein